MNDINCQYESFQWLIIQKGILHSLMRVYRDEKENIRKLVSTEARLEDLFARG